jgi:hypothetical protein
MATKKTAADLSAFGRSRPSKIPGARWRAHRTIRGFGVLVLPEAEVYAFAHREKGERRFLSMGQRRLTPLADAEREATRMLAADRWGRLIERPRSEPESANAAGG